MTGKLSDEIEFQFLQERAASVIPLADFPSGRFIVMVLGADDDKRCATASNMEPKVFVETLNTTLKAYKKTVRRR
jgi:hypothetical protein